MTIRRFCGNLYTLIAVPGLLAFSTVQATTVQFQTDLGSFEVNLYDETTPLTVANFLTFLEDGDYSDSIVHRSVDNFVIQGGGYNFDGEFINTLTTNAAVTNEPVYSNLRGTISMAKLNNSPNSATSQWFINLKDNSTDLDPINGGFTVFGEVTGNGMDVVDAIAALPIFNTGSPFTEIPLQDYTADDASNNELVTGDNLVLVNAVVVLDAAVDTASDLSPAENTLLNTTSTDSSGGGGSPSFALFLLLLLAAAARKIRF